MPSTIRNVNGDYVRVTPVQEELYAELENHRGGKAKWNDLEDTMMFKLVTADALVSKGLAEWGTEGSGIGRLVLSVTPFYSASDAGTFKYKVQYVDADGNETAPDPNDVEGYYGPADFAHEHKGPRFGGRVSAFIGDAKMVVLWMAAFVGIALFLGTIVSGVAAVVYAILGQLTLALTFTVLAIKLFGGVVVYAVAAIAREVFDSYRNKAANPTSNK